MKLLFPFFVFFLMSSPCLAEETIRVGIIGLDTSHVIAFTKLLNDLKSPEHVAGATVVAAYPAGSPDNVASSSRVAAYTRELAEDWKVEIQANISDLLRKVDVEREMTSSSSVSTFNCTVSFLGLLVSAGFFSLFAKDQPAPAGQPPPRPRLFLSRDAIVLKESGGKERRFASIEDLLREIPRLEGDFVVSAEGSEEATKERPTKGRVEANPSGKGKKIRIEAGEIPVLEFARFLADYTGLPVLHDSSDKALTEGTITVPAPIAAADYNLVKKILEAHRIRVSQRQVGGKRRIILLESQTADSKPEEPVEQPIVVVEGAGEAPSRGTQRPGVRMAKGPERRTETYGGITIAAVPEIVRAQVDLQEGRGVLVAEVNESLARAKPDVSVLKRYDIITHVNEVPVASAEKLIALVRSVGTGEVFHYRVIRKGILRILRAQGAP